MTATTTEANTELIDRIWEEAVENGEMDVVDEVVASDYVLHTPGAPEPIRGPDGVREIAELLYAAFPDSEVELEQVIADGDWIAQRVSVTATHDGEFMGIEPTGNHVDLTGVNFTRFEDGKWVEGYELWDMLGLLTQIGAVEPPNG